MPGPVIDLRSDTVTKPTPAMREAMASADVGDDQFGEDPTVNALQAQVAALLGKEAALWVPSGTMANQLALRIFTRPGDDVIVCRESHVAWHETGGAAANAGVQLTEVGAGGCFTAADFLAARRPRGHMTYPPTTLLALENTHNRAGGVVVPLATVQEICAAARAHEVATFLDGARLWNAAVATGIAPADFAAPVDLVTVAFSKGLGAPAGSLLAGSRDTIARAVRYRRMFGGAMRQVGILAAAAAHALAHHVERLAEDHANARAFADRMARHPRVVLDPSAVRTNIVMCDLTSDAPTADTVVARARAGGVLVFAFGPRRVRAVTHLDVTHADCLRAADVLLDALSA